MIWISIIKHQWGVTLFALHYHDDKSKTYSITFSLNSIIKQAYGLESGQLTISTSHIVSCIDNGGASKKEIFIK